MAIPNPRHGQHLVLLARRAHDVPLDVVRVAVFEQDLELVQSKWCNRFSNGKPGNNLSWIVVTMELLVGLSPGRHMISDIISIDIISSGLHGDSFPRFIIDWKIDHTTVQHPALHGCRQAEPVAASPEGEAKLPRNRTSC